MRSNLRKVTSYLKLLNEIRLSGGVTFNINTGEMNPTEGYMVSLPNHEQVVDIIDEETVRSYILNHTNDLAKPNAYFGCWFDGQSYVLDISENYERKRDAVFYALMWKQKAIWDCVNKDEILVNPRGSIVKQYINS